MIAALGSLFRPSAYAGTSPNVKLDLDRFAKELAGPMRFTCHRHRGIGAMW
jgi:hypothetical protein